MKEFSLQESEKIALELRIKIVKMCYKSGSSHVGSALSIVDILTVLYFYILNISLENYKSRFRDKFILSKGHAASALYAVLSEKGFIQEALLDTYGKDGSLLCGHPKKGTLKGIEASTGSLGHGLAIGCGLALSDKNDDINNKTVILMGDGECNEGSVWESAMFASTQKLNNLLVIVDKNNLQGLGRTTEVCGMQQLSNKWLAFGWNVINVNGHCHQNLFNTLKLFSRNSQKPTVVIANTVKGKGVSYMEDKLEWHYKSPNEKEYLVALKELS